jgi:hypothetical protein
MMQMQLTISEFGAGLTHAGLPVPKQPALRNQVLSIGPTSIASQPFTEGTRLVELVADAPCSIRFGKDPVASVDDALLVANTPKTYLVEPSDAVAVLAREGVSEPNDLFGLLRVIGDPKASEQRLAAITSATDELREVRAETAASQAKLAEERTTAEKELADAKAKAEAELAAARQEFENERLRKENELAARAARLSEMEARAQADADEAARLKSDLRRRLDLLAQAGAA